MLQIIIAILYITFICWSWGLAGFNLINRWTGESFGTSLPLCSLFGLALVGIVFQLFSIVMPMGGWHIQIILLLPALILFLLSRNKTLASLKESKDYITGLNLPAVLFLCSGLLIILVVGAWHIINPDTLGYHAPIITWNEKYKLTPGIANLNGRLGLQSSWFIVCALFNFSFSGTTAFTFINSTILGWFVLLLAGILSKAYNDSANGIKTFLTWFVLCFICFGVNTQVYLTASSANPDFAICIFLWACFYLLLQQTAAKQSITQTIATLVLLSFSISLKLSALPVLLLLPLIYLQLSPLKFTSRLFLLCLIPALALQPFIYRSYIITGYPLFPTVFLDYFNPDWKADPFMTRQIDEYITAYAKVGFVTIEDYAAVSGMPFSKWFPYWIEQYTSLEIIMTGAAALAIVVNLVFIKDYFKSRYRNLAWITGVCLFSSILLMIKAPAPRFSQAFLVPLILAAIFLVIEKFPVISTFKWIRLPILLLLLLPINGYIIYRFYRYFDIENIWKPYGITAVPLQSLHCDGMKIYLPLDPSGCGNAPVPCANNACITYAPRGTTIEAGFKARKH